MNRNELTVAACFGVVLLAYFSLAASKGDRHCEQVVTPEVMRDAEAEFYDQPGRQEWAIDQSNKFVEGHIWTDILYNKGKTSRSDYVISRCDVCGVAVGWSRKHLLPNKFPWYCQRHLYAKARGMR